MSQTMNAVPKKDTSKKVREKFRKRRTNLFKKANALAYLCDAQVYVIVGREDKYFAYKSTGAESLLRSVTSLVSQLYQPFLIFC